MTRVRRTIRIDHTADNLFELVSGIETYPDFIKWILSMAVKPVNSPGTTMERIGTAQVGFRGFSETFATKVVSDAEARTVEVSLVRGPLKHLNNSWKFIPRDDATDVEFFVDFEFKNLILRALASANFELAMNRIMAAFVSEADRRYGRSSAS
ncbi:type II toxin-antitoxin system RatA family toxin [Ponticaulis sp.]|uniref:type II toxin-antitoxin system RatA family toxin n=1 Tax=Ponticaulis sp. TaxID=2020902 RepID=UPI000C4F1ECB|nr:type II toxin-antitoxin system RatA family toxin [Ponticaulis sp.]MAJ08260.1 ubiquinone-binding protein [Ponticaulis sp.]HBH89021.1 ubiquinone-binding protein [Hyphomonadaceae bacterium]HBJ92390.1 ubiquinone-binding protein [Hyphomonadaceae bacterium]|tara:strand:+ start:8628 stop:9086 length:459 start_codon:yes stop_codon:yes gene_type:complete